MSRGLQSPENGSLVAVPPVELTIQAETALAGPAFAPVDQEHVLEPLHLLSPHKLPQVQGFELAGCCHSSQPVGGDFYDVISTVHGQVWLIIADVMGKGVTASLLAATVRGLGRMLIRLGCTPSTLLRQLNDTLFDELSPSGTFVTAQAALVDIPRNRILLANAGHCPLLAVPKQGATSALSAEGLPLGVFADVAFQETTLDLDPIECLLLHTDGVTDALSPTGERFGLKRLGFWLTSHSTPGCSAATLKDTLKLELQKFQAGRPLQDDQTFLFLSRSGTNPG
jgi:phosphoserine phosphatase RsbU/P